MAKQRSDPGWRAFTHQLPKEGESNDSNRDVAYVNFGDEAHVVVCDGTTSGWDSGWWAWLVAREVGREMTTRGDDAPLRLLDGAVANARRLWSENPRPIKDDTARLFASTSAERFPAATTVAALTVQQAGDTLQVSGAAVGDTFIVALIPDAGYGWQADRALPSIQAFGSTPRVVFAEHHASGRIMAETLNWTLPASACLIVGTDALMQWAFRAAERSSDVWTMIANADNPRFRELVAGLRSTGEVENDDMTLVQLRRIAS